MRLWFQKKICFDLATEKINMTAFIKVLNAQHCSLRQPSIPLASSFLCPLSLCRGSLHMTSCRQHGDYEWHDPKCEDEVVNITYVNRDGTEIKIRGKKGDNVMYLAHRYEIEIEGTSLHLR